MYPKKLAFIQRQFWTRISNIGRNCGQNFVLKTCINLKDSYRQDYRI
jgi:hypothetical protein